MQLICSKWDYQDSSACVIGISSEHSITSAHCSILRGVSECVCVCARVRVCVVMYVCV